MMILSLVALLSTAPATDVYRIDMPGPGDYESWAVDHEYDPAESGPIIITAQGENGSSVQTWPSPETLDSNGDGKFSVVAHYPKALGTVTYTIAVGEQATTYRPVIYQQQNRYILPLAGNTIVSRGLFNQNGHGWYTSRFAYDFLGLDKTYAPMTAPEYSNANLAGFGMPVIAPADGVVVFVEDRLPDQEGEYDAESFRLPDGSQAYHGNTVIIDHGKGEFVALMHLKQGSIRVAVGDHVVQGQPVGALGNSGDSSGPHLHVQLQAGPLPQGFPSLPLTFADHGDQILESGDYLTYRPVNNESRPPSE